MGHPFFSDATEDTKTPQFHTSSRFPIVHNYSKKDLDWRACQSCPLGKQKGRYTAYHEHESFIVSCSTWLCYLWLWIFAIWSGWPRKKKKKTINQSKVEDIHDSGVIYFGLSKHGEASNLKVYPKIFGIGIACLEYSQFFDIPIWESWWFAATWSILKAILGNESFILIYPKGFLSHSCFLSNLAGFADH